ncbi:MAG: hypothetical protein P1U56_23545 [Saprospiraceae bacterium]|nr:hypothetical protein [Saprospiraceae bacterium]
MIETEITTMNPFPGLRSFEEDESHLFFGREVQIDDLLKKLRTKKFIAVLGTSGSGKSSVVKSGLIPSLYSGFMSGAGSGWRTTTFKPGNDPIGNLARSLSKDVIYEEENNGFIGTERIVEKTLRRSNRGIIEVARQFRICDDDNLLIIVDQFEELFRFSRFEKQEDPEQRDALSFVNLLREASQHADIPVYIVITMRSDFLGDFTNFRGLTEVINEGQYLVPRMTREELKLAITGPIAVGGASIDKPLLTHLLNDIGDNTDQLPILQHALMRTWDFWEQKTNGKGSIGFEHYRAIGTMKKALSDHANEAYEELNEEQKRICKAMFSSLTDKQEDVRGIRRPTQLRELAAIAKVDEAEVKKVIEVFRKPGRSFLMCPPELKSDTIIDISHESLMRIWDRLLDWLDDEKRNADEYLKIAIAAQLYEKNERSLYNGPELALAERWWQTFNPTAKWAERYDPSFERARHFLELSKNEEEREAKRKERDRKLRRWLINSIVLLALAAGIIIAVQQFWARRSLHDTNEKLKDQQEELKQSNVLLAERERILDITNSELESQQDSLKNKNEKLIRQQAMIQKANEDLIANEIEIKAKNTELEKKQEEISQQNTALEQKAIEITQKNDSLEASKLLLTNKNTALTKSQQELQDRNNRLIANSEAAKALVYLNIDMLDSAKILALKAYDLNKEANGPLPNQGIYDALLKTWATTIENPEDAIDFKVPGSYGIKNAKWNNQIVSTTGRDNMVRIWDLKNGLSQRISRKIKSPLSEVITSFDFISDKDVMIGTIEGKLYAWQFEDNIFTELTQTDSSAIHSVLNLSQGAGTNLIVTSSKEKISLLTGENFEAKDLSFGNYLKVDAHVDDGYIWIAKASPTQLEIEYYTNEGTLISTIAAIPLDEQVTALEIFHLDGQNGKDSLLVAAGFENGKLMYWNESKEVNSNSWSTVPHELLGQRSSITDIEYNVKINKLGSCSLDNTARIWDLGPEGNHLILKFDNNWIHSIAFSPDSEKVVLTGESGVVRILPITMDYIRNKLAKN